MALSHQTSSKSRDSLSEKKIDLPISPSETLELFYVGILFLFGVLVAQCIATVQVYLSNIDFYRQLIAVENAGYMPIPNPIIMATLPLFKPAFYGGLFFTLTVGTGLSAITMIIYLIYRASATRLSRIVFVIFWIACIAMVNSESFCLFGTIYFVMVPLSVLILSHIFIPDGFNFSRAQKKIILHGVSIILLAALGSVQLNKSLFTDIRNEVLMTNVYGMKINEFYYQYTLYAAQAFKSLRQKQLKTCHLTMTPGNKQKHVQTMLESFDYLPIDAGTPSDLAVSLRSDTTLEFRHNDKKILETTLDAFLKKPAKSLQAFSKKTDGYASFRRFTGMFLIFSVGLACYLMMYLPILTVCGMSLKSDYRAYTAIYICFMVGALLVCNIDRKPQRNISSLLKSDNLLLRVEGLQKIYNAQKEIGKYPVYRNMITSPHTLERFYLARALSHSRLPDAHSIIVKLLDDPNKNVVYEAFFALGERKDQRAIPEIIERIQRSDHWYVQLYAYRALRRLGWKQTLLK